MMTAEKYIKQGKIRELEVEFETETHQFKNFLLVKTQNRDEPLLAVSIGDITAVGLSYSPFSDEWTITFATPGGMFTKKFDAGDTAKKYYFNVLGELDNFREERNG